MNSVTATRNTTSAISDCRRMRAPKLGPTASIERSVRSLPETRAIPSSRSVLGSRVERDGLDPEAVAVVDELDHGVVDPNLVGDRPEVLDGRSRRVGSCDRNAAFELDAEVEAAAQHEGDHRDGDCAQRDPEPQASLADEVDRGFTAVESLPETHLAVSLIESQPRSASGV